MSLSRNILSSQARVQAPWIKVTIGKYTFGVFDKKTLNTAKSNNNFYLSYKVTYPSYITSLNITKINGQVNQYSLHIDYPVRPTDDPNFFEKVFSSVSDTRKIVFSYGDASMPSYIYKDEEALITNISQSFNLEASTISYDIKAVSSAIVAKTSTFTFLHTGKQKPSSLIKKIFLNPTYGLRSLFTGMNESNLNDLINGTDKEVELSAKTNISPLDYINYLVSCMIPDSSSSSGLSTDIYILTLHDDTVYDKLYSDCGSFGGPYDKSYSDSVSLGGPYFKVTRTSTVLEHSDAYEIDIGYNTATIVRNFQIQNQENYSLYYSYNSELYPEQYNRRLNNQGQWEDVLAPMNTSNNNHYHTKAEDIIWYTKMTKYPISATIVIQGLLRPAQLMQYLRLNVVFPGGNKHTSSGLYIITKQEDRIDANGYITTLTLTRISS